MKELNFESGGRPIYSEDINILQENAKSVEEIVKDNCRIDAFTVRDCIVSGLNYSISEPDSRGYARVTVTPGCALIDEKLCFSNESANSVYGPVKTVRNLKPYLVPVFTESEQLVQYKDGHATPLYWSWMIEIQFLKEAPIGNYMLAIKDPSDPEHERVDYREIVNSKEIERINELEPRVYTIDELDHIFDFSELNTDARIEAIKQWIKPKGIVITRDGANCGYSQVFINEEKTLVTQIACVNYILDASHESALSYNTYTRFFNLKTYSVILGDGTSVPGLSWSSWKNVQEDIETKIKNLEQTKATEKDLAALSATVSDKANQTYVDQIYATIKNLATSEQIKSLSDAVSAKADMAEVDKKLSTKQDNLLGEIKMWAGQTVPENYMLCNGQELKIADYEDLYNAIGDVFNGAMDFNGAPYSTNSGYFRLPDLQGRFIVGKSGSGSDYNATGNAGGLKEVTLTSSQSALPQHQHTMNEAGAHTHTRGSMDITGSFNVDDEGRESISGAFTLGSSQSGPGGGGGGFKVDFKASKTWTGQTTTEGTHTHIIAATEQSKAAQPHENRPPFYTLAYIIRVK